ncbi:ParA family protein [Paenibacillus faecis]|nr:ParA family protein [Paenibacillus faecis]
MSNKPLIVIWGNPSSGKTTATVKLAQALAAHRKNVLVIFSDALCPSIATIVPQEASKQQSLGELLSLPSLTQEDLLRYSLSLKDTPYVALLGYKKGDHLFSYANYSRERAIDLLTLARHTADVVLVDCASYVSAYLLSTVALEMADTVFQFHTCDLKSMLFYASYLPLLSDTRFKQGKTIPILSNVKPEQDGPSYSQVVGGVRFLLPHVPALEQQMMEGKLLEPLSGKQAAAYGQSIDKMTGLIIPEDVKKPRKKPKEPVINVASIAQRLKELWNWRGAKK